MRDNLAAVREKMSAAAAKANRSLAEIRLVAVTKYVTSDSARQLIELGVHDLAESRPQAFWQKVDELPDPNVRWHFVGHLQRNKLKKTLPHVHLLHSADSLRLLQEIDEFGGEQGTVVPLLLEVNTSGDQTKHGFTPSEMNGVLEQAASLRNILVRGLMTMAALEGGLEVARANFSNLRELRDQLRTTAPENVQLDELSMGMSDDFPIAIEEGATLIRVGSALFEGVEP
jgi:pyridoxal phosphate enzyme (YggS family)